MKDGQVFFCFRRKQEDRELGLVAELCEPHSRQGHEDFFYHPFIMGFWGENPPLVTCLPKHYMQYPMASATPSGVLQEYPSGQVNPAIPPHSHSFSHCVVQAMSSLVEIGPAAVPALINALKNEEPRVRSIAAEALGKIGSDAKTAVPDLDKLLDELERE